ncbi:cell wall-binding repeat-containing protein, partial [Salinibacterium xinjiangense]|uniref:cell wall-binding repeat-containing protein n=1 Tax=Salinibacterium xinjiangense TaxID=386302 RepID=UPI0015CA3CF2
MDRFATSAAISAASFSPGVPIVYIANGYNFPDALSAAPAAGKDGAPVLLSPPEGIPSVIQAELTRLKPGRIVVLGGTNAMSDNVLRALAASTGGTVSRLSGVDRFATSAAISAASFSPGVPIVYIANGYNFPDALSAAPAAGKDGAPVLLSPPEGIPSVIQAELTRLKPGRIVVLGGTNAMSDNVAQNLAGFVEENPSSALTATPAPLVSGEPKVGSVLTAVPGSWQPSPVTLSYRWAVGGAVQVGETSATYKPAAADIGKTVTVTVTGAKSGYGSVSKTSAATTPVLKKPLSVVRITSDILRSTVWTPDNIYVIDSVVRISSGATLSISPGVSVKGQITVSSGGVLNAIGTAQQPVIFTDTRDDSVGGDTNGDGNTTTPNQMDGSPNFIVS